MNRIYFVWVSSVINHVLGASNQSQNSSSHSAPCAPYFHNGTTYYSAPQFQPASHVIAINYTPQCQYCHGPNYSTFHNGMNLHNNPQVTVYYPVPEFQQASHIPSVNYTPQEPSSNQDYSNRIAENPVLHNGSNYNNSFSSESISSLASAESNSRSTEGWKRKPVSGYNFLREDTAPLSLLSAHSHKHSKFKKLEIKINASIQITQQIIKDTNPERKKRWKDFEDKIVEIMVERIKKMRISCEDDSPNEFLFKEYTYDGDESLMSQMAKWNRFSRETITNAKLTFAEVHVLIMKIEKYRQNFIQLSGYLVYLYTVFMEYTTSPYDSMYGICVFKHRSFSYTRFSGSFWEYNFEELDEPQFMKLFNLILTYFEEINHTNRYDCLYLFFSSLSLNRKFVLSPGNALEIAKKLLQMNCEYAPNLLFEESIFRNITLEGTFELLEHIDNSNVMYDSWFFRFYFFYSLKFKAAVEDQERASEIIRLHNAFVQRYEGLPGFKKNTEKIQQYYSDKWDGVAYLMGNYDLWKSHGIYIPKMLFELRAESCKGYEKLLGHKYRKLWMKFCITHVFADLSLEELIEIFESDESIHTEPFIQLLWRTKHIISHSCYDEAAFKKFFQISVKTENFILQILLLLVNARFLEEESIKEEIVGMFDVSKHPWCIYLPYIGDALKSECPTRQIWTVQEYITKLNKYDFIMKSECNAITYYLYLMFTYKNSQIRANLFEFVKGMLLMENLCDLVKERILCSLANKKYYSRYLLAYRDQIIQIMEESKSFKKMEEFKNDFSHAFERYHLGIYEYCELLPMFIDLIPSE